MTPSKPAGRAPVASLRLILPHLRPYAGRAAGAALALLLAAGLVLALGQGLRRLVDEGFADGAPGQWWYEQVSRGLRDRERELPSDYVELTELHVSPTHQGRGIGGTLLRRFLADRPESRVLLSTPEVEGEDNSAWRLYRSLGFTDVLRSYRFEGDARPFAVLERTLPLPVPGTDE